MIPAAVSQTETNMEINWASRIEVEVLRMLRYWRMSGTVMSRTARRNLSPEGKNRIFGQPPSRPKG